MRKAYSEERSRTGKIIFSERRIIITSGDESFYVHPPRAISYIHGDIVSFVESRSAKDRKMAEAKPVRLIKRSEEEVIIEATPTKKGIKWSLLPIFGKLMIEITSNPKIEIGDLYIAKFESTKKVKILRKFGNKKDASILEELIFFRSGVRTKWPKSVEDFEVNVPRIEEYGGNSLSFSVIARSESVSVTNDAAIQVSEKQSTGLLRSSQGQEQQFGTEALPQSFSLKGNPFPKIKANERERLDFRSWYTMTIDGADAKDLDDAISIARYEGGDTLLGVHIADVAEYVGEKSPIDIEAYIRGTSIYTPGKVIPMLPEILSNDLCSLHPGGPKLVLSILLRIDRKGYVKESFVSEGVIESRHRGVYEEIQLLFKEASRKSGFLHAQEGQKTSNFPPKEILENFESLYHLLRERRKKEGKIIFDTTECYFDIDDKRNVTGIRKRERGDTHMIIEEFMVLANEEVAKWAIKRKIPFLSRVHDAPSVEKTREIASVLLANKESMSEQILIAKDTPIEPHHIRSVLEHAESNDELSYRLSRLLLPKMAKAVYKEKPVRHFGLALTHYAHFTSPIRRYPDLLLHRMIKYHLSRVSKSDKKSYDKQMKKWGESLSEKERTAEDVSRSIDDIFMCRYMSNHVEDVYDGVISGVTESNVYVELPNGVEGSIFLAGKGNPKLTLDLDRGSLRDKFSQEVYQIGKKITVKVVSVDIEARRIEMESIDK